MSEIVSSTKNTIENKRKEFITGLAQKKFPNCDNILKEYMKKIISENDYTPKAGEQALLSLALVAKIPEATKMIEREIDKLKKLFEGIKNLKRIPEAIFVTDSKHDAIAIKEAKKAKVKIIGVVDSNVSPEGIDYLIPCNDDATKAVELVLNAISSAVKEGRSSMPVVKEETK
jgi:hypothetical protein